MTWPMYGYAFAKLAQHPPLSQEMARQHGGYYLNQAATWADLYGHMPDEDLADLQFELENIDAAVQWASTTHQLTDFIRQWPGLAHFLEQRGGMVTQMSHANDIVGV